MSRYALVNPTSSAAIEVRGRLDTLDYTEVADRAAADILILAIGRMEGRQHVRQVQTLRAAARQGVAAVLSARCETDDWHALLAYVPTIVSCSAARAELSARLENAGDATQRMELARTGQRRLSLLRASIEEVSMIDMRTGMYNRRFLLTRLREALSATRRYGRPLTLCVFRIQEYDTLVNTLGDDRVARVIEALSDTLAASLRSADVQAWIGPSEFALLLPETPDEGAQRVVDRVEEQAQEIGQEHDLKLSVISEFSSPEAADSSAEVFLDRLRTILEKASAQS